VSPTPVLVEASGTSNSDGASHPPSIDNSATLQTVSRYNEYSVTTSIPPSQPLQPRSFLSALSPLPSTSYPVPNSAPNPTLQWNAGSIYSYTPLLDPNIVRPSSVHRPDFRVSTPPLSLSSNSYLVPKSAPTPTRQWNPSSFHSYTLLLDPNIVGPSPVHASALHRPSRPALELGWMGPSPTIAQQTMDEGKVSVSIDFGKSSAPTACISAHS